MFSWDDYIKVAKRLQKYAKINSTVSEGFYRSGVSRAYYAAYHDALFYAIHNKGYNERRYRSSLRARGLSDLGSHSVLIQYLLDDSDPNVQLVGVRLKNCRGKRVTCDYDPNISVDDRYTTISFTQTDSIHSLIDTLP